MKFLCSSYVLLASLLTAPGVAVAHVVSGAPEEDLLSSSYEAYAQKFRKSWSSEEDFNRRRLIFERNVMRIQEHNSGRVPTDHWLGLDEFTDMEPRELYMGYDKSRQQQRPGTLATTQQDTIQLYNDLERQTGVRLDDPVDSLPSQVDWRKEGVTTPVKSQGQCGSCWAFASTAVLESHLAIQTGTLMDLSVQELVSCVPDPNQCGGDGGCAGSTAELAFAHVQTFGMVSEWEFGYQSYHPHGVVECSLEVPGSHPFLDQKEKPMEQQRKLQQKSHLRQEVADTNKEKDSSSSSSNLYLGAVMGITGWVSLPSNNYGAVMNAVAKLGPLAVSVACNPWFSYHSGVFASANFTQSSETDVNHLVVLEGYGTDEATGLDYWLVRNSWGSKWGEGGYIRLRRSPDQHCGIDVTPSDGVACNKDDNGNDVTPPDAVICGNSGILYDVSAPLGGFLA